MDYAKIVEDVLDVFSIDTQKQGARDFVELVILCAAERIDDPEKAVAGAVLNDMARRRGMRLMPMCARMRAAIRPLLEADDEALALVGIHAARQGEGRKDPGRITVGAMAYALEGRVRAASLQNQDC